jgi:hypothetical protein
MNALRVGYLYYSMVSSRATTLMKIMEIDNKIAKIKSDQTYRKARRNLRILKNSSFGSRMIRVQSPEDKIKYMEVRRGSKEMKELTYIYEDIVEKYTQRMNELTIQKLVLRKKLFS